MPSLKQIESSQVVTRIQKKNVKKIMDAALDVFSRNGFGGTTIDQIATQAGLSKPNILYYFNSKEEIHFSLLQGLLEKWLEPLKKLDPLGNPISEITDYVQRKLEMSREFPRESRSRIFNHTKFNGTLVHFAYDFKDWMKNLFLREQNDWNFFISVLNPEFLYVILVQHLNEILYHRKSLYFHLALLNWTIILSLLCCYVLRI